MQPRDLILPSGRRFSYDIPTTTSQEGGSTTTITLPGGTTQIKITIQTGILGLQKIFLDLPGLSEPWVTYWQEGKRLVHVKPPSGNGKKLFYFLNFYFVNLVNVSGGTQKSGFWAKAN